MIREIVLFCFQEIKFIIIIIIIIIIITVYWQAFCCFQLRY